MIDKQWIKAEAKNLGFSFLGFTGIEPLESFSVFEEWVQKYSVGDASYLTRQDTLEKRKYPAKMFPGAQSILVMGAAYPPSIPLHVSTQQPEIAAYALPARDYHLVFKEQCQNLINLIQTKWQAETGCIENPPVFHAFSDSAPVLEKALAQRAGLGWIGKNGCFIHPVYGSWVLLAEIFTTLYFEPDQPYFHDLCGRCNRCRAACPTQCILENKTIDITECLSYQTIENKGTIPSRFLKHLNTRVFGCDRCQQVCSWNAKALPDTNSLFYQMPQIVLPQSFREALEMDQENYHNRFEHTSLQRLGRERWLRNIIAAGDRQNLIIPESLPPLAAQQLNIKSDE